MRPVLAPETLSVPLPAAILLNSWKVSARSAKLAPAEGFVAKVPRRTVEPSGINEPFAKNCGPDVGFPDKFMVTLGPDGGAVPICTEALAWLVLPAASRDVAVTT